MSFEAGDGWEVVVAPEPRRPEALLLEAERAACRLGYASLDEMIAQTARGRSYLSFSADFLAKAHGVLAALAWALSPEARTAYLALKVALSFT